MLCPNSVSVTNRLLHLLHQMEDHTFYLTGSRFFGTNTLESDWDFFCGDGWVAQFSLQQALTSWGFERITQDPNYRDPWIKELWIHRKGRIHIQILPTEKVQPKLRIQTALKEQNLRHPTLMVWAVMRTLSEYYTDPTSPKPQE